MPLSAVVRGRAPAAYSSERTLSIRLLAPHTSASSSARRRGGAAVMRRLCRLVCARLRALRSARGPTAETGECEAPDSAHPLPARDLTHLDRLDFFTDFGKRLPELTSRGARLDVERGAILVAAGAAPIAFL
jgi:hypothetical protein